MKKQSIVVLLTAALLTGVSGCAHRDATNAGSGYISRCAEDVNGIPEIAALRKSRNRNDQENQKAFEGLELALTINKMVTTKMDDQNVDDVCYAQDTRENFDKLLRALAKNDMPPTVDFIIGNSIDKELQEEWLRSGNLIGNMTYDRWTAKKKTADEFIESIARNERALAPFWEKFPLRRKYFRYPGLKIAADNQDFNKVRTYLKQQGYVEVNATIYAQDGLFNEYYCAALARGERSCANYIKATFKSLLLDTTLKAREAGRRVGGREIKHILMVRASQLICDTLDEILAWYKALGARFVTLDEVLSDPFYSRRDAGVAARRIIDESRDAQLADAELK